MCAELIVQHKHGSQAEHSVLHLMAAEQKTNVHSMLCSAVAVVVRRVMLEANDIEAAKQFYVAEAQPINSKDSSWTVG